LAGRPTSSCPPLDAYLKSYQMQNEIQLDGFCEPFLGRVDRTPKVVFLSLNPGQYQPEWQNRRDGTFVNEIRTAGT
jgi:hypothetical protein